MSIAEETEFCAEVPGIASDFEKGSLGTPHQIRRQRLGHSGNSMTDGYTHTFSDDERAAAEKLGELFGTGWPEIDKGKLISFPNLSQKQEWPAGCRLTKLTVLESHFRNERFRGHKEALGRLRTGELGDAGTLECAIWRRSAPPSTR